MGVKLASTKADQIGHWSAPLNTGLSANQNVQIRSTLRGQHTDSLNYLVNYVQ
ncbi:hypothetical protein [Lactococcus lactis]|uniref:hypothetical protein n=1 Tax=Lactococcus lactis TaxID=1358 RepID=UPI0015D5D4C4|nr:hypothetical protein [Lactococcus lactis]MDG4970050.1 hypothetical protein [Lactococcus lactis]MDG5103908.1 hypothetical protein [Lactococcus lactis]